MFFSLCTSNNIRRKFLTESEGTSLSGGEKPQNTQTRQVEGRPTIIAKTKESREEIEADALEQLRELRVSRNRDVATDMKKRW